MEKITKRISITNESLGAYYAYGKIDNKVILKKKISSEKKLEVEQAIKVLQENTERVYVEFVDEDPILNHKFGNIFIGIQYNVTRFSNTVLQTLISFMVGETSNPIMGTMVNLTTRFKGLVKEKNGSVVFEKCDFGKVDKGKFSDVIIPEDPDKIENLRNRPGYEPFECKMTSLVSDIIQADINAQLVCKPYLQEEIILPKPKLQTKNLLE